MGVSAIILVWLAHLRQAMPGAQTGERRVRLSCSRREHLGFEQVVDSVGAWGVGSDGDWGGWVWGVVGVLMVGWGGEQGPEWR